MDYRSKCILKLDSLVAWHVRKLNRMKLVAIVLKPLNLARLKIYCISLRFCWKGIAIVFRNSYIPFHIVIERDSRFLDSIISETNNIINTDSLI